MSWDISQLPDVTGKTVVITGASSGIGLYAAKTLAHHGAKVVMLCRNVEKMASVASSIISEKESDIVQLQCDVSDLESVRACAEAFKNAHIPRIDVLVLNAGILKDTFTQSPQHVELTFATNHLGHWLLTGLLLEYMKDVSGSRIIAVSSLGHHASGGIDYEIVKGQAKERYNMLKMYNATKLANHWMTLSLNRRLEQSGAKTVAVAAHPGTSTSHLTDQARTLFVRVMQFIGSPLMQTAEQGSWPLVMAATDPDISKECYYGPRNLLETSGPPISNARRNSLVNNFEKAEELWAASEDLCSYEYGM